MSTARHFFGKVEAGRLRVPRTFADHLKHLDGCVVVSIEKPRQRRSSDQNAYYWGVVLPPICEHTGYAPKEQHDVFKKLFLPKRFMEWNGRQVEVEESSRELSPSEFSEFVERVRYEASEMGIVIPDPDEHYKDKRRIGEV